MTISSRFRHLRLAMLLLAASSCIRADRIWTDPVMNGERKAADPDPSSGAQGHLGRGLYVIDGAGLATDESRRACLLQRLRDHRIDQIVLYGLGPLLEEPGRDELARFVQEARSKGGVHRVGAAVAGEDRVEAIARYHQAKPEARFDLLVTELEYWNRCEVAASAGSGATAREACFGPMRALLLKLRSFAEEQRATGHTVMVGAYLGYPNRAEVQEIAREVDFVLLNYPVRTPQRAWHFERAATGALAERFEAFMNEGVRIWPLFYAQGEVHMGPWLKQHGTGKAEAQFLLDLDVELGPRARRVLGGFQYFGDQALLMDTSPPELR